MNSVGMVVVSKLSSAGNLFLELFTRSLVRAWLVHALLTPMPHVVSVRLRPLLYRMIGCKVGKNVTILRNVIFEMDGLGSYSNLVLGDRSYIGRDCFIGLNARVILEDDAALAPYCKIHVDGHDLSQPDHRMGALTSQPVTIGRGAFVGAGAVILAGVTIGAGAVIGAESVVTKDVPPNVIAAGSPAKVIKELG